MIKQRLSILSPNAQWTEIDPNELYSNSSTCVAAHAVTYNDVCTIQVIYDNNTCAISTDNGETWTTDNIMLGGGQQSINWIYKYLVGTDNGIFYNGTLCNDTTMSKCYCKIGNTFFASYDNSKGVYGIIRSTDGGETWSDELLTTILCFAMTVSGTGRIYAGGYSSLKYSDDNGDTWTSITLPDQGVISALHVTETGRLIVGFSDPSNFGIVSGFTGIYYTDDNIILTQASIPSSAASMEFTTLIQTDGVLFASCSVFDANVGKYVGYVLYSSDNGETWAESLSQSKCVLLTVGNRLFAFNNQGWYRDPAIESTPLKYLDADGASTIVAWFKDYVDTLVGA